MPKTHGNRPKILGDLNVETLTWHICKKCALNASEHLYNLVCDLKNRIICQKHMAICQKKCPPTRAGEFIHHGLHTTRNPAVHGPGCRPVVQNFCCQQAPRGRGDESQAMYCLQLIGAWEGSRSRVYKPVRRSLAWRGGTKLPPPNGCALRCALRGSALGPIRAGWPRAALPAR